jgi:hypothetical protein
MVIRVEILMHKKHFMLPPNGETWGYGILPIPLASFKNELMISNTSSTAI